MLIETVSHEQFLKGYPTTSFVESYYLPKIQEIKS